jgi:U3 small nucleolar RNA-associated protein 21
MDFTVTAVISVPTYVNKMLLGGADGQLELWNINKSTRIHRFSGIPETGVAIQALAAAPVLDMVGVGYQDGSVVVLNLRSDELVMKLSQKEHGPVTCMSFRNDTVGGQLVSGTEKGDLVIWDLNKRSVHSFHRNVHPGGVGTVEFFETLPLMLSAGKSDNALSVHIFDLPDGGCRLLKERRGFTSDLAHLLPYGEHDLLVASCNEVGRLNLIQSHQDRVWSQNNLQNQTSGLNSLMPWKFRNFPNGVLPPVTSITYCSDKLRHFDWPTVITTHEGCPDAYIWSPHQEALVNRMLIIKDRKASTGTRFPSAVQVAVSTCGNYAVLGLENGELHRFNVQSCYHRGLVGTVSSSGVVAMKFISPRDLVTADKEAIKLWKVVPRPELTCTLTCVTDIVSFEIYGFLCAVSHSTGNKVSIVDIHTDRRVRTVEVSAPVTAMGWASGGKWLAVATADSRMILYDMPTASVIDKIVFSSPAVGVRFVNGNSKIVTSHEGGKGSIRVWQNVALLHGPGPLSSWVKIDEPVDAENIPKRKIESDNAINMEIKKARMEGELVMVGGSKWQYTLKLDEIKERNKPARAAEKAKSAPFFLPVRYQGVQPVFAAPAEDFFAGNDSKEEVRIDKSVANGFIELVKSRKFDQVDAHLTKATASGVHICISELEEDEDAMNNFIEFLALKTNDGNAVDLVATWTSLFLKSFGKDVRGRVQYKENLELLARAVRERQTKFELDTNQLQCLLKVTAALQLHR